jgi:predicted DCC family thiol-disulfide oxidoreductase YuxK
VAKNKIPVLVLFDGVCNLCNASVQFIIKRDPGSRFQFASLQSARGQAEMKRFGLDPTSLHSIIVIEGDRVYQRSNAALKIATTMGGLWSAFRLFYIFPRVFRDPVYNLIARNRYRLFGKQDHCMLPSPELKSRFVE